MISGASHQWEITRHKSLVPVTVNCFPCIEDAGEERRKEKGLLLEAMVPSLISLMVSVDVKHHGRSRRLCCSEPVWPSGKVLASKHKDFGSIPLRLSFLFKACGLWTVSSDFVPHRSGNIKTDSSHCCPPREPVWPSGKVLSLTIMTH